MDTSAKSEQAGKCQFRSVQEKLRIVEEANRPGSSVAAVALRNGVNANLVFGWRRLHRRGLLERQRDVTPRLLPVKVTMPTLTPSERATAPVKKRERANAPQIPSCLEIVFSGEMRVRLHGGSDDGGDRAAAMYSLLGTAQLNGLNIEAYLRYLFERLPEHPINRIEELLPWAIADQIPDLKLAA